jgi:hypothetical protein
MAEEKRWLEVGSGARRWEVDGGWVNLMVGG